MDQEQESTQIEMPQYQSHKKVWALKIKEIVLDSDLAKETNRETDGSATITPEEEGYAPFKVDHKYVHKHNPQSGGYYVRYEDGYCSWSPAKAFEEGNALIVANASRYHVIKEKFKFGLHVVLVGASCEDKATLEKFKADILDVGLEFQSGS